MNLLTSPLDIIGVIIWFMSTRQAVKFILSSKQLLQQDGWKCLKRIDFDLPAVQPFYGYPMDLVSSCLEQMAASFLRNIAYLDKVRYISLNNYALNTLPSMATTFHILMHILMPQLEECHLYITATNVLNSTEFARLFHSNRLRSLALLAEVELTRLVIRTPWPTLETLCTHAKSWIQPGVAPQPKLQALTLHWRSDVASEPSPSEILAIIQPTIDSNPSLTSINIVMPIKHARSVGSDRLNWNVAMVRTFKADVMKIRSLGLRNLPNILRLFGRPMWAFLLFEERVPRFQEAFDSCYTGIFAGQQLRDICSTTCDILVEADQSEALLKKLESLMGRYFEQHATIESKVLLSGLMALCSLLYSHASLRGKELFWRRKMQSLSYSPGDHEAVQLLEIEQRYTEWFEKQVMDNPTWEINVNYIKILQSGSECSCSIRDFASPAFELFIAQHPVFLNETWLLQSIADHFHGNCGHICNLYPLAKLAVERGYKSRLVTYSGHTPSDRCPWAVFFSPAPLEEKKLNTATLLLRIFADSVDAITVGLVRLFYWSFKSFTHLASLVRAYNDSFAQISKSSVDLMKNKFADAIWRFVLEDGPNHDWIALVQMALNEATPIGFIKEILELDDRKIDAHSHVFGYSAAVARALRAELTRRNWGSK